MVNTYKEYLANQEARKLVSLLPIARGKVQIACNPDNTGATSLGCAGTLALLTNFRVPNGAVGTKTAFFSVLEAPASIAIKIELTNTANIFNELLGLSLTAEDVQIVNGLLYFSPLLYTAIKNALTESN